MTDSVYVYFAPMVQYRWDMYTHPLEHGPLTALLSDASAKRYGVTSVPCASRRVVPPSFSQGILLITLASYEQYHEVKS